MISPIFQMGTLKLWEAEELTQVTELSHVTLLPHSLSTLPQSMLCVSGAYGSALNHWGPRRAHLEVARSPRALTTQMSPWSKYCGKLPPNSDLRQQSFLFSLAPRFPHRTVCVQPSKTLHPGEQRKIWRQKGLSHSPPISTTAGSEHQKGSSKLAQILSAVYVPRQKESISNKPALAISPEKNEG